MLYVEAKEKWTIGNTWLWGKEMSQRTVPHRTAGGWESLVSDERCSKRILTKRGTSKNECEQEYLSFRP